MSEKKIRPKISTEYIGGEWWAEIEFDSGTQVAENGETKERAVENLEKRLFEIFGESHGWTPLSPRFLEAAAERRQRRNKAQES